MERAIARWEKDTYVEVIERKLVVIKTGDNTTREYYDDVKVKKLKKDMERVNVDGKWEWREKS